MTPRTPPPRVRKKKKAGDEDVVALSRSRLSIAVGIRLSRETKTAIDTIAKDEGRSCSNLVQRALDEWLKARAGKG